MIGLALWVSVLVGAAATFTSILTALALRLARPSLERVEPRARARIWTFAALLPLLVSMLLVGAVLVPHSWLGLPEHCVHHDDDHLHLCVLHGAPAPSLAVIALSCAIALRIAAGAIVELARAARASLALRRVRVAGTDPTSELVRLPFDAPVAFTAGWLRPQVFASACVADRPERRAVLAHEEDHARHRDPLVRLLARLAAVLHAPGIAGRIVRELAGAQELAADEHAARVVGDRLEVAEQILAFARDAAASPSAVAAFAEGEVARRVRTLLEPPDYVPGPSLAHGLVLVALGGAATALAATSIHHAIEGLLALVSA